MENEISVLKLYPGTDIHPLVGSKCEITHEQESNMLYNETNLSV